MPFLSVVIPTRLRPELLALAVESAINQTDYDDFEVVVSVNGEANESRAAVERFPSKHLRYFEIGEDVDAYSSWHFAASQSQGEYMLLLADDDALVPTAMASYAAALEAHGRPDYLSAANAWYGHHDVSFPRKNALRFRLDWDLDGLVDPDELLTNYFAFRNPTFSPTYQLVSSRVRQAFADQEINPYLWPFPDYGMQAMALAFSESACLMSEPTVLHGYAADSAGDAHFGPRENVVWKLHNGEDAVFDLAPLSGCYYINGWAETLLRAKELLPDRLAAHDIDWMQYYSRYANEMAVEAEWRDVSDEFAELCSTIMESPEEIRVPLLSSPNMIKLLDWLKRMVDARSWERLARDFKQEWLRGEDHDFDNIVQCARAVPALYQKQRADRALFNSLLPPP